jgi:hypothetical protein
MLRLLQGNVGWALLVFGALFAGALWGWVGGRYFERRAQQKEEADRWAGWSKESREEYERGPDFAGLDEQGRGIYRVPRVPRVPRIVRQ